MPLWYYEKKDLRNTPSLRDGIDSDTEARYRREGARFIVDCGTKLGLRYDSCATGVVFFHRFYMFHSFRAFHRHVTAACCLFLAGKTEETPKKCKDIIKTTRSMLTDGQFMVFGKDPMEEVMTMERILLQTIKFDLMVEHPYAYLLKFAKMIKSKSDAADKGKVQKLVQMAWTFINDSLCTMLCLQWEPEVIAVSLMYLASRLTKTEVSDWQGKPPTFKGKWWEYLVEDITQELLEDVCHQVLDLYSNAPKKNTREDSPPPPPPPPPPKPVHPSAQSIGTPQSGTKRPRSPGALQDSHRSHSHGNLGSGKMARSEKRPHSPSSASKSRERYQAKPDGRSVSIPSVPMAAMSQPVPHNASVPPPVHPPKAPSATTPSQNNPYVTPGMYSSSFMTQEGSQSIQSLVGGRISAPPPASAYPASQYPPGPAPPVVNTQVPPPVSSASFTSQPPPGYQQQSYQQQRYPAPNYPPSTQSSYSAQPSSNYSQPYNYQSNCQYQQPAASTYTRPPPTQPPPQQPPPAPAQHHGQQHASSGYSQSYSSQQYPPPSQTYSSQYPNYNSQQSYQNYTPTQPYQAPQGGHQQGSVAAHPQNPGGSGLSVRMTTRQ